MDCAHQNGVSQGRRPGFVSILTVTGATMRRCKNGRMRIANHIVDLMGNTPLAPKTDSH